MLVTIRKAVDDGRLDTEVMEMAASYSNGRLGVKKAWKESYEAVKGDIKILREAYKKEIEGWNKAVAATKGWAK